MSVLVKKKNQTEHDSVSQGLGHHAGDKQMQRALSTVCSVFFFPAQSAKPISYVRTRIQNLLSELIQCLSISVLFRRQLNSKIPSEFMQGIGAISLPGY